jgi:hypothetical protein
LEVGKTSIVGGLNIDRASNHDSGVPGITDIPAGQSCDFKTRNGQKTQTVMLLRATIIPSLIPANPGWGIAVKKKANRGGLMSTLRKLVPAGVIRRVATSATCLRASS